MESSKKNYWIYRADGFPSPYEFYTLDEAIQFGKNNLDLFSVKNMITGDIDYSNFLA